MAIAVLPQSGKSGFVQVRNALLAGHPVACFGYPAETAGDGAFLSRLAREKDIRYAVLPLDAWMPEIGALEDAIKHGQLGNLLFLQIECSGSRGLIDLLAGAIAIALRLQTDAVDRFTPAVPNHGQVGIASLQLRIGGCAVQITAYSASTQTTTLRFQAVGSKARAVWDGTSLELQAMTAARERLAISDSNALRLAAQAFQSGHPGAGPSLDQTLDLTINAEDELPMVTRFWASQDVFVHGTAIIDPGVEIGAKSKIWHFSHVLSRVRIGHNVNIGQNVVIGPDVSVGDNCKIQNNVSLYKGVTLEQGVFCGPSCVFTNVNNPRAEIERKNEYLPTLVKRGASIGANATIVCGNTLGSYCFIAAGAVVTTDVPDYALMAGIPARRIGWMSRAGYRLGTDLICPAEGRRYREVAPNRLEEVAK